MKKWKILLFSILSFCVLNYAELAFCMESNKHDVLSNSLNLKKDDVDSDDTEESIREIDAIFGGKYDDSQNDLLPSLSFRSLCRYLFIAYLAFQGVNNYPLQGKQYQVEQALDCVKKTIDNAGIIDTKKSSLRGNKEGMFLEFKDLNISTVKGVLDTVSYTPVWTIGKSITEQPVACPQYQDQKTFNWVRSFVMQDCLKVVAKEVDIVVFWGKINRVVYTILEEIKFNTSVLEKKSLQNYYLCDEYSDSLKEK